MERRKKRSDKLIAGFLALLTAFSPIASVVPVYASGLDDDGTGSSVTMDPDSITVDETGSDGIVLDNSGEGSDGITVIGNDDESGSDGIVINDDQPDDGIDVGTPVDSGDGISIEDPESDGIEIDQTDTDDGISIDQTDDGITIDESGITIDPWAGVDDMDDYDDLIEHSEDFENKGPVYSLDVDLRSVHGSVVLTPVDSEDLKDQRVIRVMYSEDDGEYVTVVTDGNGDDVYTGIINDIGGLAWAEFVDSGYEYFVEILADEGYFLHNCSIVNSKDDVSSVLSDSVESDAVSYKCQILMNSDILES